MKQPTISTSNIKDKKSLLIKKEINLTQNIKKLSQPSKEKDFSSKKLNSQKSQKNLSSPIKISQKETLPTISISHKKNITPTNSNSLNYNSLANNKNNKNNNSKLSTLRIQGPLNRRPATKQLSKNIKLLQSKQKIVSLNNQQQTKLTSLYLQNELGSFGLLASLSVIDNSSIKLHSTIQSQKNFLIHIKGKRRIKVKRVPLSWKSLNKGDSFILDTLDIIYIWNGIQANRMEKAKAIDLANQIKNKDKNGRATIVDISEKNNEKEIQYYEKFWKIIGGSIDQITNIGEEDEAEDEKPYADLFIGFFIENNIVKIKNFPVQKLDRTLLSSNNCFLLYCQYDIYIWIGRKSSIQQREQALLYSQKLLKNNIHSKDILITKIHENTEPILFKEKFWNWGTLPISVTPSEIKKEKEKETPELFDINLMFIPKKIENTIQLHNGTGFIVNIWKIIENQKIELSSNYYGQFYSGESYIILYKYILKNRDEYCIYFWQGRDSTINEKGTSAYLTVDLDSKEIGGSAAQIRIVQNKEPKHFMAIFPNQFIIIHKGKPNNNNNNNNVNNPSLYQVFENSNGIHIIQINVSSCLLNSNHCFILCTLEKNYVWIGKGSSEKEKNISLYVVNNQFKNLNVTIIEEGNENSLFWKDINDQKNYMKYIYQQKPRFFHCSNASGIFKVEEIIDFCQDDLIEDDLIILDCYYWIFIWVGSKSSEIERKLTLDCTISYIEKHPDERTKWIDWEKNTFIIYSKLEPLIFTCHFIGWDYKENIPQQDINDFSSLTLAKDILYQYNRTYSYQELLEHPNHLDPTRLETYLSDNDFQNVFGFNKNFFYSLPLWKQIEQKKLFHLY